MWGTLRSAIIAAFLQAQETILEDGTVLVSLQQDSNKVGFCTTIHDSTEQVVRTRKRPKGTSTSATITKEPFKMFNPLTRCKELYEHTRDLPIPVAIDDYNRFIGGVDIADQLRAGFSTQQRGVKPWRSLFYQLLDSTIINAFILSEHQRKGKLDRKFDNVQSAHWTFQEELVIDLLKDPNTMIKQAYVIKSTTLPRMQLTKPIGIHQQIRGKQLACLFCRWCWYNRKSDNHRIITLSNQVLRT